jgi:hypothetical protein
MPFECSYLPRKYPAYCIKEKNGPIGTGRMRDIRRKALENYNGDPPVKEEYAKPFCCRPTLSEVCLMKTNKTKTSFLQSLSWLLFTMMALMAVMLLFKHGPVREIFEQSAIGKKVRTSQLLQNFTGQDATSGTGAMGQETPDLTAAEAKALKEYPHLASSYRLTNKVLRSSEEWDEIRAVHSDRAGIAASAEYLTQDEHISELDSLAHFRHIDYLKRVLTLVDNPAEEFAYEKVATVLNFEPKNWKGLDEKQKQLVLGDKIDLIYVMKAYAPATLERMLNQSNNKRLAKLVKYAEENREFLQLVDL